MFTRKGDEGSTDNVARERVSKGSIEVAVEGLIDETVTILGVALVKSEWPDVSEDLKKCQVLVFNMGEQLLIGEKGRKLVQADLDWLEERTVSYKQELGKVRLFVLPGGTEASAFLHLARVTVRRLERDLVLLNEKHPIDPVVLQFANRFSSLLFMMALIANKRKNVEERIWDIRRES